MNKYGKLTLVSIAGISSTALLSDGIYKAIRGQYMESVVSISAGLTGLALTSVTALERPYQYKPTPVVRKVAVPTDAAPDATPDAPTVA